MGNADWPNPSRMPVPKAGGGVESDQPHPNYMDSWVWNGRRMVSKVN